MDGLYDVQGETANKHDNSRLPEECKCKHEAQVKVLREEDDADAVDEEGEDLGEDHVGVPRRDLEGDHDELVEHQCRERDADDVEELVLK